MSSLTMQLGEAKGKLSAVEEARQRRPAWLHMIAIGTLFTGLGGVEIGAEMAGIKSAWGIEYDPQIAAIARANLKSEIHVADVLKCNPHNFDYVDVLHASPPCPNFSTAKAGLSETSHDLSMAAKVAEFITVLHPKIFTLENVIAYRRSKCWALIENALHDAGYWVHMAIINSADYGVPQSRRRLMVRAVLGGFVPCLPDPTPRCGWYSAVKDIIDDFSPTHLADWQLRLMPDMVDGTLLVSGGNASNRKITWQPHESAPTITAGCLDRTPLRAMLGDGAGNRVVAFTPRGVARLMSFPDRYELPESRSLAGRGLGNAVPPLAYQQIAADLTRQNV